MSTYTKNRDSNLKRPATIDATKFSEYKLDKGGLEHVVITQKGKHRLLKCVIELKTFDGMLEKGHLICVGDNANGHRQVFVMEPDAFKQHYTKVKTFGPAK